ncbi:MAG TPA: lipid-A-disaccharide synthase N-terminal domain-containing protein [bacterium]|nr:lipid-A-disaccharide synthase N-terminal domain-containing protein [bacterium]
MNPDTDSLWVVIGFMGQALFGARFVWQWFKSERKKRVIVPMAFWFLSVGGGMTLLAYAIHRRDPVFIAGQGIGLCIYARNIMFAIREKQANANINPSAKRLTR